MYVCNVRCLYLQGSAGKEIKINAILIHINIRTYVIIPPIASGVYIEEYIVLTLKNLL